MLKHQRFSKGLTLLEVIIAFGILAVLAATAMNFQIVTQQRTNSALDRSFAAKKAITLLEEVRMEVEKSSDVETTLDQIDDGDTYNLNLTIRSVENDHPLSGNVKTSLGWKWSRKINISTLPYESSANVRMVRVTIALNKSGGKILPLASIGAIIHAPIQKYPPSQAYDLYLLTLESSPSWWVHMSLIKPFTQSVLDAIQGQNPGLIFRSHWINQSAYGRNRMYAPYINETLPSGTGSYDSTADPMPYPYIYPGKHPKYVYGSDPCPERYYDSSIMEGVVNRDGELINDYVGSEGLPVVGSSPPTNPYNPWPHALCDRFNHGMRYLEEKDYYEKKKLARKDYIDARRNYLLKHDSMEDKAKCLNLPPQEPTFHMLLEAMNTSPDDYHNAIFLNLHGETMPLPAMRNYSDGAKYPNPTGGWPGVRVVTHPERVYFKQDETTQSNTEEVRFRVYSYLSHYDTYKDTYTDDKLPVPITLVFRNMDLTKDVNGSTPSLIVKRIYGGYNWTKNGLSDKAYGKDNAPAYKMTDTVSDTNEMFVRYRTITTDYNNDGTNEHHTVLYLYNTPLECPYISSKGGLYSSKRLLGLEYIPCSPNGNVDFTQDLTNTGGSSTYKNTARWVIIIPKEVAYEAGRSNNTIKTISEALAESVVPKVTFRVETRIGRDLGNKDPSVHYQGVGVNETSGSFVYNETQHLSGTMYPPTLRHQPENVSYTYTWWSSKITSVPFTELFQFLGDPRHSPYIDTTKNGTTVNNGYNPYHKNIDNWNSIINSSLTMGGWGNTSIDIDIPRFLQVVRRAIVNSELLYTTLTGFSYYYAGIGGEIGSDASNGFDNGVRVVKTPWGGTSEQWVTEFRSNMISYIVRKKSGAYIPIINWLGELYHDEDYTRWYEPTTLKRGNVTAGTGSSDYMRISRSNSYFDYPHNSRHQLCEAGSTCALHIRNSSSGYFGHIFSDNNNAYLQSDGEDLSSQYALALPSTIPASRPWRLTYSWQSGWWDRCYDLKNASSWTSGFFTYYTGSQLKVYYKKGSYPASGLIELKAPSSPSDSRDLYLQTGNKGYVMVNGISPASTTVGVSLVAKLCVITLLHSFLELGAQYKARQLPQIEIMQPEPWKPIPTDPSSIVIRWKIQWKRWDGQSYTSTYNGADGTQGTADDVKYPPASASGVVGTESTERDNLVFVPIYTTDISLKPWTDPISDKTVEIGDRPSDLAAYATETGSPQIGKIRYDSSETDKEFSFELDTSNATKFPAGTYYIRIQCFRKNEIQHYAYHQIKIEIKR